MDDSGFLTVNTGATPATEAPTAVTVQPLATVAAAITAGHVHPFAALFGPGVLDRERPVVSRRDGSVDFLALVEAVVAWRAQQAEEEQAASAFARSGVSATSDTTATDGHVAGTLDTTVTPHVAASLSDALLECVPVDLHTFTMLVGDYSVQHAANVAAEPFDATIGDKVHALQYHRLFPLTGGLREGFDRIKADLDAQRSANAAKGGIGAGAAAGALPQAGTLLARVRATSTSGDTSSSKASKAPRRSGGGVALSAMDKRRARLLKGECGAAGTRSSAANAAAAQAREEAEIARLEAMLQEHDAGVLSAAGDRARAAGPL